MREYLFYLYLLVGFDNLTYQKRLQLIPYTCGLSMARDVVPLNFSAFLEKAKLKDDGSNYTDWVRNLRIIPIDAQKNYVLEAPLGAKPAAGATPDVMNVW